MTTPQNPSIGRIVHYVIPSGPHAGAHRPAIITAAYADGLVNLTIFTDQEDDCSPLGESIHGHLIRGFAVRPGNPDEINTWHWPERKD